MTTHTPDLTVDEIDRTASTPRRASHEAFPPQPVWGTDSGELRVVPLHAWYPPIKHVIDVLLTLVLFVPAELVVLLAAVVTRLTSPGPVFYWQTRVGRNGRLFRLCKLRTMVQNAEAGTGAVWSQAGDPRVTRFGKFLRKTHIDEFPQLLHVLTGEMSLIGPRPERPEFVDRLQWQVPHYTERLNVKPGVTGLAQLVLPPDSDLEDVRRKVQHDVYYVRHVSLWLDARIAAHTAWLLVRTFTEVTAAPFRLPRGEYVYEQVAEMKREGDRLCLPSNGLLDGSAR